MPASIKDKATKIYREPGSAIEGDKILVQCRKPVKKWSKERASGQHHYYATVLDKNAFAVLIRSFKNIRS